MIVDAPTKRCVPILFGTMFAHFGEPHAGVIVRSGAVGLGERPFLQDLIGIVVAQTAGVAAVLPHDAIEQGELGVAAIHDVQAVRLDRPFQHGPSDIIRHPEILAARAANGRFWTVDIDLSAAR